MGAEGVAVRRMSRSDAEFFDLLDRPERVSQLSAVGVGETVGAMVLQQGFPGDKTGKLRRLDDAFFEPQRRPALAEARKRLHLGQCAAANLDGGMAEIDLEGYKVCASALRPNIVMIVLESITRAAFFQYYPKTAALLQANLASAADEEELREGAGGDGKEGGERPAAEKKQQTTSVRTIEEEQKKRRQMRKETMAAVVDSESSCNNNEEGSSGVNADSSLSSPPSPSSNYESFVFGGLHTTAKGTTAPNMLPVLSGHPYDHWRLEEMKKFRGYHRIEAIPHDDYVWSHLRSRGYITMHASDECNMVLGCGHGSDHNREGGFDHIMPLPALHRGDKAKTACIEEFGSEMQFNWHNDKRCIAGRRTHEHMFTYIEGLWRAYPDDELPKFALISLMITHATPTMGALYDEAIASALSRIMWGGDHAPNVENGEAERRPTVFVVMGDHGYMPFDRTAPMLSLAVHRSFLRRLIQVRVPGGGDTSGAAAFTTPAAPAESAAPDAPDKMRDGKDVSSRSVFRSVRDLLLGNQERLLAGYDVYVTIKHLADALVMSLSAASGARGHFPLSASERYMTLPQRAAHGSQFRPRSLLDPAIPMNRTCAEAGVQPQNCECGRWRPVLNIIDGLGGGARTRKAKGKTEGDTGDKVDMARAMVREARRSVLAWSRKMVGPSPCQPWDSLIVTTARTSDAEWAGAVGGLESKSRARTEEGPGTWMGMGTGTGTGAGTMATRLQPGSFIFDMKFVIKTGPDVEEFEAAVRFDRPCSAKEVLFVKRNTLYAGDRGCFPQQGGFLAEFCMCRHNV